MNVRLADDKMLFIFSSRAIFDTIIHKYLDYHVHACLFFFKYLTLAVSAFLIKVSYNEQCASKKCYTRMVFWKYLVNR